MGLLSPTFYYRRITDIKSDFLISNNIKCLLLDVDNTLALHHCGVLCEGVKEWIDNMTADGIKLIIVSNSKEKRIKPFASSVSLQYVSLAAKPLPFGIFKALRIIGNNKNESAIIGDQIFTDILGANISKIKSVLVRPYKLENKLSFKIRRYFEKLILKEKF